MKLTPKERKLREGLTKNGIYKFNKKLNTVELMSDKDLERYFNYRFIYGFKTIFAENLRYRKDNSEWEIIYYYKNKDTYFADIKSAYGENDRQFLKKSRLLYCLWY